MSETPTARDTPIKRWWNPTLIDILAKLRWNPTLTEMLWIVFVAVVVTVLHFSEPEYVADGTRELPVRVFVFDINTGKPVRNAEVGIIKAFGLHEIGNTTEITQQFTGLPEDLETMPAERKGQTDEHGFATFQEVFSCGSSNTHPNTRVFPGKCWVFVTCQDFRGGIISLGRDAVEYGEVKRRGGFLVPIGIMRENTPMP